MKGQSKIVATHIVEKLRPYPHFIYLLKAIETLIHTGRSPYPAETKAAIVRDAAFLYPPVVGWLAAPLTVLPGSLVEILSTAAAAGARDRS